MNAGGSSQSRGQQSTKPTTISSKSGKTTAYAEDYEQHLIDHGIYPVLHKHPDARPTPKPSNLGNIRQRLAQSRASLSPSQFDESAFNDFQRKNIRAVREKRVVRTVVPVLGGNSDIPNEQDALFTKLSAITDDTIPKPMPDYFDGARRKDIHGAVKDELGKTIIPTGHVQDPVLPNFFLEAKGRKRRRGRGTTTGVLRRSGRGSRHAQAAELGQRRAHLRRQCLCPQFHVPCRDWHAPDVRPPPHETHHAGGAVGVPHDSD